MIKKVSGELFLGGDLEIEERPVSLDAEFAGQTRNLREAIRKAQQTVITMVLAAGDTYKPTGPVVESTLAERGEGSNE